MTILSLYIAATGMNIMQENIDVISNNIANLNSTAYKRQRAEFQDLLYQTVVAPGSQSSAAGNTVPTGIEIGLGARLQSIYRVHEQGALLQTSNELDVAIDGRGYFAVTLPDGTEAYSRAGTFQLNENGDLVNLQGYEISPGITIPQDAVDININPEGVVEISLEGQADLVQVGQLELVLFQNEAGLESKGSGLYLETTASGSPITGNPGEDGFGFILQGFVESSNVDAITEITQLISAQRGYEMSSRVISTTDEMMQTLTQQI